MINLKIGKYVLYLRYAVSVKLNIKAFELKKLKQNQKQEQKIKSKLKQNTSNPKIE
ncbi:hypothetical protein MsAc7_13610 [Methanolapillus millepedarum]|uniref:Uncharacterized protein n=1 Tax=Methanolapillus millepedarum TaxID=3028296 RepID=A0AA96V3F6_9EURY|nr:hypothetical protein MsAc7_13610 [Methanosarcinaceae archaeon Ac7]